MLAATGCLFITSAVESVDDTVLERLRKGHTRADFERAVELCRAAGLALSPTFVPFTPWTTRDGYADLLATIRRLDLVEAVAPIQLGDPAAGDRRVRAAGAARDHAGRWRRSIPTSLTWPWQHADARVDGLQRHVMSVVSAKAGEPRGAVFEAIEAVAGVAAAPVVADGRMVPPYLTEGWYCCAEPGPEQLETL